MTDKKFTDEEIIEALDLCTQQNGSIPCYDCPCWNDDEQECEGIDYTATLDLIKRQKAEIERLRSMNCAKLDTIHDLQDDTNKLKEQLQDVTEKFNCQQTVYTDLSKIIKDRKGEIEKLKNENKILSINADNAFQDGLNEAQDLYAEQVKAEIKFKAVKEFAEKLKEECCDIVLYGKIVTVNTIDNLLKEMGGEE